MDSIFTTLPKQRTPVSPKDLESPVKKEAWYREAAGFEAELRDLFNRFRRGIIDKEEYIRRTQRILQGNPEDESTTGLVHAGGQEPWGDPIEGLCLTPKFFMWRRPYQEEYDRAISQAENLLNDYMDKWKALDLPIGFPDDLLDYFSNKHGMGRLRHLQVLLKITPDDSTRAVIPAEDQVWLEQAKTEEEFVAAFQESWRLFRQTAREYKDHLDNWQEEQKE